MFHGPSEHKSPLAGSLSQSNELTIRHPEVNSALSFIRGFTKRQSATCPTFDMVWLDHLPIQVGGGGSFPHSNDFYLPSLRVEEGGGGRHPVVTLLQPAGGHTCWVISSLQPTADNIVILTQRLYLFRAPCRF